MLRVPLFRQRYGHCGPAALKILLGFYGVSASHRELAKISKATGKEGTSHKNLISAARYFSFGVEAREYGDWKTLDRFINKKKVPVLIDWFSETDGHYSVVVKLTKHFIWIADPEYGKVRKFTWRTFNRLWFDFEGDFIKKEKDLFLRWYMVIKH